MSVTWSSEPEPEHAPIRTFGWVRVARRGLPMVLVLAAGVIVHSLLRVIERPFFGQRRPWTPKVTQLVCRGCLACLGLKLNIHGDIMRHPGAVVANHSSWLDIFVLNARKDIYFVAKSEVSGWPGIGLLAKITGTIFIKRDRKEAQAQAKVFEERLSVGHRLLFFPEGTSSDGQRVLPFKTTLFAPFLTDQMRETAYIQPVSVVYHAPSELDRRFYGWWGGMSFGGHLVQLLAAKRNGSVDVICGAPRAMADQTDRKALARDLETEVRANFDKFALEA